MVTERSQTSKLKPYNLIYMKNPKRVVSETEVNFLPVIGRGMLEVAIAIRLQGTFCSVWNVPKQDCHDTHTTPQIYKSHL